jgi:hypothetical protein
MSTLLTDPDGVALVAAIHTRKRLTDELAAADDIYSAAIRAVVGGHGDWTSVRQAGEVVRQCRAALKAAGGDHE